MPSGERFWVVEYWEPDYSRWISLGGESSSLDEAYRGFSRAVQEHGDSRVLRLMKYGVVQKKPVAMEVNAYHAPSKI